MNKTEYMNRMRDLMENVDQDIVEEIMQDYEEHFSMGMKEGRTEEEIAAELGDPEEMAKELKDICGQQQHTEQRSGGEYEPQSVRRLNLECVSADVEIDVSEDGMFHLRYENDGSLRSKTMMRFREEQKGTTYYAKEEVREGGLFGINRIENCSTRFLIEVPEEFEEIEIRTTSGDIEIEDVRLEGKLRIQTVSGDVNLDSETMHDCEIISTSGDIEIEDVKLEGKLRIQTVSGDMNLDNETMHACEIITTSGDVEARDLISTDFSVKTVSGDVDLDELEADRVDISSTSGDVEICMSDACEGYTLKGKTTSGDIDVAHGKVSRDFVGASCYIVGEGSSKVNIKTLSGDISVR